MRIKKLLTDQAGVTILEGVIALGLLALVSGGAFAVLLSASRSSMEPDVREEMLLAVEKASDKLKSYLVYEDEHSVLPAKLSDAMGRLKPLPPDLQNGLCGSDPDPFSRVESHNIKCMLPPVCDKTSSKSEFKYNIEESSVVIPYDETDGYPYNRVEEYREASAVPIYRIVFTIKCNGYEL